MRNPTLILTLIFSVMFSSTSFADWKKVGEGVSGDTFYVDFDRIRKRDGYVYYWWLIDFLKHQQRGALSHTAYAQGSCKILRYKILTANSYKEPMGQVYIETDNVPNPIWRYPPPDSANEEILKSVCKYAK